MFCRLPDPAVLKHVCSTAPPPPPTADSAPVSSRGHDTAVRSADVTYKDVTRQNDLVGHIQIVAEQIHVLSSSQRHQSHERRPLADRDAVPGRRSSAVTDAG